MSREDFEEEVTEAPSTMGNLQESENDFQC